MEARRNEVRAAVGAQGRRRELDPRPPVAEAQALLQFTPRLQRASLKALLKSAGANAENNLELERTHWSSPGPTSMRAR